MLDEFDAQATLFVTGDWCDRYPEDVMMFYEAGHEIRTTPISIRIWRAST